MGEGVRPSYPRLMIEALVAAGPRKYIEEYPESTKELCEDCAGFRSIGDYIIFWICDGMSKSNELPKRSSHPGFNTRILAQDLGEYFANCVSETLVETTTFVPGLGLPKDLLNRIAQDWQKRLSDYFADVEVEGELEQFLCELPDMPDGSYRLVWPSTLLGGVFHDQNRTLDVINIGTSGAVVIGEPVRLVLPNHRCELLRATIWHGDQLQVAVSPVEVNVEWEHFEEVECFLAMSDGLSRSLNLLLQELSEVKNLPFGEMRRRLLTRGELTYDDQAVVIGRLMPG